MIRGIGPVYARRLVRAFGARTAPRGERYRSGPAGRITDAWAEQKVVREVMVFLHSHGVGTARAVRIFRTYGADVIGASGSKTADAIAMKLGIAKTAMIRVRAGIGYH